MLDMIFSSVLLPEPLRPTMPKNSPWWTSKVTSRSAMSCRYSRRRSGCSARSLKLSIGCSGMRKALPTSRTSITTGPSGMCAKRTRRSGASPPASQALLLEAERVGEGRVAQPPPRSAGGARERLHKPPPGQAADELGLAGQRLGAPDQHAGGARGEPGERRRRAVGGDVAQQRAALGPGEDRVAAREQDARLDLARQVAEEVGAAPAAQRAARAAPGAAAADLAED